MLPKDISFCHFTIQEAQSTQRHNIHIAISNTIHYSNFQTCLPLKLPSINSWNIHLKAK